MKKKVASGMMLTLLLMGMLTLAFNIQPATASLPVHNIDTGEDFATIHEAIDDVDTLDGHTIQVDAGIYYENVVVNKAVSLIGENRETTIIDGGGAGIVVQINANMVLISNFTIRKGGIVLPGGGIKVNASYCNITNNKLTNNWYGVCLLYSSNNTISKNNIMANDDEGILLSGSSNNAISGNNITANHIGVHLSYSSNNNISGNNIANNGHGLMLEASSNNIIGGNNIIANKYKGTSIGGTGNRLRDNTIADNGLNFGVLETIVLLSSFVQEIDTSNTVDGKPIYYLISRRDFKVPSDAGYVALVNCTEMRVENLNLKSNVQGVLLAYTQNSTITQNNITNNSYGIYLRRSSNISIAGNNIANNEYGIRIFESSNNSISRNNITGNSGDGIGLGLSSNYNSIAENNIRGNRWYGVGLYSGSSNNTISINNIVNNWHGVHLDSSSTNSIYYNNFVNNTEQVRSYGSVNVWDNSYPSGGNYWSDQYHGDCADHYSGPNQDQLGSDGIVDEPYVIDESNQDNYPLMEPWTPPPPIPTTIDELKTEIEELGSEGEIDNQGIVVSLIAKLNVAQKLVDKGKIDEAKSILEEDFIPQVQNLTDTHITPEAAEILIESAEYIISNL